MLEAAASGARPDAVAVAPAIAITADSSFVPVYAIRSHRDFGLLAGVARPKSMLPLGRFMVESGLLTRAELNDALALQRSLDGRPLGWIVKTLGHCDDFLLARMLAAQRGVPCVSLSGYRAAADCRKLSEMAPHITHCATLLHEDAGEAWIAVSDATDPAPAREVTRALQKKVAAVMAERRDIADFQFRREFTGGRDTAADRQGA